MNLDTSKEVLTRRTLLSRIKDTSDNASWQEFFDIYWKLIYNAAIKTGLTPEESQEVVQETVISVAQKIPEFEYRPEPGSFKRWLLNVTHWRITDQFRKRSPAWDPKKRAPSRARHADGGSDAARTATINMIPDDPSRGFERLWNEEWENHLTERALRGLKESCDPKHYQIFDLCVLQNWPVTKVAGALNIRRAFVYLVKHRMSKMLKRELRKLERVAVRDVYEKSKK